MTSAERLLGRTTERAVIDQAVNGARSGRGGGLVVYGEPGIGKSALLDDAVARADEMMVVRASGVESESDIDGGTLHQLLLPLLDRVPSLPDPQRRALQTVLGETTGTPDRFFVALAALSLLADAAAERPVLCVVDDAQWCDGASLDAIGLVTRRLGTEPISIVVAARPDEGRPLHTDGFTELPLTGLRRADARELLVRHSGSHLSDADRDRVVRACAGNPLALREMARSAKKNVDVHEPLPMGPDLCRVFTQRVRRQSPTAQWLLLLVAVGGPARLEVFRGAASVLGLEVTELVSGDLDQLLDTDGTQVSVRHPLVRAAIYHDASPAARQAAHGALATALQDVPEELERRAWHLARSTDGPDELVAKELERAAQHALTRAGPAMSTAALIRAADLSAADQDRSRRLTWAASTAWQAGAMDQVVMLLDREERTSGPDTPLEPEIAELRATVELLSGRPADALALLRQAIPIALRDSRGRAVSLLLTFGEMVTRSSGAMSYAEITEWLAPLRLDGDDRTDLLGRLLRAAGFAGSGRQPRLTPGDRTALEQLSNPVDLVRGSALTWVLGDAELGRRMRRKAERQARVLGASGTLAWALELLVADEVARGHLRAAATYADEGRRLAAESGQTNTTTRHGSWLALLAARRGRDREATRLANNVLAEAAERELDDAHTVALQALGEVDLLAGRYAEAVRHFDATDRGGDPIGRTGHLPSAVPFHVEAAVRAGDVERAAEAYQRFAASIGVAPPPEAGALAARCRALLAPEADADDEYLHSLELHACVELPYETARTELLFGQHLRRTRRPSAARPHLRAAHEIFRRIGADPWAELATEELRATGETRSSPEHSKLAELTPQELRVALVVGEGITNREAAARLFLSPRTIDYHLRKMFQKLGIGSRAELMRLVLASDVHEP